jgi:hypothetical protein
VKRTTRTHRGRRCAGGGGYQRGCHFVCVCVCV